MAKIKICGLSRKEDILYANEFMPDYIGFVFYPKSKRYITFEKASQLKAMLSPDIKAVGVFVDETIENIVQLCQNNVIDLVQLHGSESEEFIARLKKNVSQPVIKALRLSSEKTDTASQKLFETTADFLLIDSTAGSGKTFDWKAFKRPEKEFFAAGGINIKNVQEAINTFDPYAVDISSGVETDGVKDREKIKEIINLIRRI